MADLKIFGNTVLIEPEVIDSPVTESGILVSKPSKKKRTVGRVVAVGPGLKDLEGNIVVPNDEVSIGDRVIFMANTGQEITVDEVKYILMFDYDVLAILDESDVICTGYKPGLK
jgi:chaperonin GroES